MMKAIILLCLFAIASAGPLKSKRSAAPHIIGGAVSAKGKWPWQLSLQFYNEELALFRHTCGAVLLNEDWVLCAAHCFLLGDEDYPEDYEILAGAFNVAPGTRDAEQVIKIQGWLEHPDFSFAEFGLPHDIALIRLSEKADLTNENIKPIALSTGDVDFAGSTDCWITGWGRNDVDADGASAELMELNIPVFTNQRCGEIYDDSFVGQIHPILPQHICVGNEDLNIGACQGDSGGPLSCKEGDDFVVAGITSRGSPDCQDLPSVYTRVSEYKDWINNSIGA